MPLFRELGYGWLQANKRSLEIDGKPYPVSHQWQSHVPVHLVSFKFDVDRRTPGATGAAQRSPYSLVQEFLNRSAQHRWGFVSNGLKLVVLHDNVSLVRASNVEFDLEAMFEGEVYSDFFLLFSLCHQSRVEILAEDRPEECWLERWSKLAEEQGTRAREKLRVGVERAIQALGMGFRTDPWKHRPEGGRPEGRSPGRATLPRAAPDGLSAAAPARGRGQAAGRGPEPSPPSGRHARGPPALRPLLLDRTTPAGWPIAATRDGTHRPVRVAQGPLREAARRVRPAGRPGAGLVPVLRPRRRPQLDAG